MGPSRVKTWQLGLFYWIVVVVCVFSGYEVVSAVRVRQAYRRLCITTPSQDATISISQLDHQASIVGVGSTKIWVKPGTYFITATSAGKKATQTVMVNQVINGCHSLTVSSKPVLPSVQSVSFSNFDQLIDQGFSSTQTSDLKRSLFKFKPSAQQISIISSSLTTGPINRGVGDQFSFLFNLTVDSVTYRAVLGYSNTQGFDLTLYSLQTGQPVYSASTNLAGG